MADRTSTVRVNVVTDASGAGAMLGKFGRIAGVAALGVGALAAGTVLGANKLYEYADAAGDANDRIENVVKTMGLFRGRVKEVSGRIEEFAKQTSLATAVDQNIIKSTQAKLLTFEELAKTSDTLGGSFDRTTLAAIDMAALGFGTAETNAVQLGKALQDPENGLAALKKTGALTAAQIKTIGDEFKRTGDIAAAQAQILAAVEAQVKGTAEETAGGFEKMKNGVKIFADELSLRAQPYMDRFGTFITEELAPGVQQLAAQVREKLAPSFAQIATAIRERAIPAAVEFEEWFLQRIVPGIRDTLVPVLQGARSAFDQVANSLKRNSTEFADMGAKARKVSEIVSEIAPIFGHFAGTTLTVLGASVAGATTLLAGLWSQFNMILDIVNRVAGSLAALADQLRNMPSGFGALAGAAGRTSAGVAGGIDDPRIPDNARTTVNVHVQGYVGDEEKLARMLEQVLARRVVRYNGVGV